jgi:glyoxylase-like metal-dependent hydrolase (beta-lactamase superfamily II)
MARRLWSILGNSQRLDGGAMFGNAPRAVWERWIPPDERHRIPLACRTMLIEEVLAEEDLPGAETRRILFETGIGAFFPPKLRDRFGVVESEHVLLRALEEAGAPHDTIDAVVLSHLHIDHAGGLLAPYQEGAPQRLLFPKATFVVGREAWERATHPHARDRASFIPELPKLLEATGRLEIVEGRTSRTLGPDYVLHRSDGHTPGLVLSEVPSDDGPIVFAADLIPGRPWVHLPITMGYDRWPEKLIDEKTELLADLVARRGRLFFTHDPEVAMGRVARDESGKYGVGEQWPAPAGLAI